MYNQSGKEPVQRSVSVSHQRVLKFHSLQLSAIVKGCQQPNGPAYACTVLGLFRGVVGPHIQALWEPALFHSGTMELPREHCCLRVGSMGGVLQGGGQAELTLTSGTLRSLREPKAAENGFCTCIQDALWASVMHTHNANNLGGVQDAFLPAGKMTQ